MHLLLFLAMRYHEGESVEFIGHISINISFVIYCIYFLPQITYNQMKHQANHISHATQILMVSANVLDLIYGFGFGLQWQSLCKNPPRRSGS